MRGAEVLKFALSSLINGREISAKHLCLRQGRSVERFVWSPKLKHYTQVSDVLRNG
jgi:hypothetical protein